MSRLPNEDWLHLAKKCAVGQQARHRHGREARQNLVVGNAAGHWWAYCQSCKAGAREQKEHAMLVQREVAHSRDLTLPDDRKPIEQLPRFQQEFLGSFLLSKGIDWTMLPPECEWSESRHRLLIPTRPGWMGRDTSGKSPQKWLTYNGQHYVTVRDQRNRCAVVTEDLFSAIKINHVQKRMANVVDVYCSLGTAIHDALFIRLLEKNERVTSFYDGDGPGIVGATRNYTRLLAMGMADRLAPHLQCAPAGLDPKDMPLEDIRGYLVAFQVRNP